MTSKSIICPGLTRFFAFVTGMVFLAGILAAPPEANS